MNGNCHNRLRSPDECVGTLSHTDLPPPAAGASTEGVLIRALRDRDEAAFESLFGRFQAPMLRTASRFVRSPEEAEEVVQDTWLSVLAGLDRFEGRSTLRTWIFRILVNRARTRAKRDARHLSISAVDLERLASGVGDDVVGEPDQQVRTYSSAAEGGSWISRAPGDGLEVDDLLGRLHAAVHRLPARQRAVITLRDIEGWSAEQVCALHGISAANQRVLLHRARRGVRAALGEHDLDGVADAADRPRAVA